MNLIPDLSHVSPETASSSSLGKDELEAILETFLGGLSSSKHQVSRNLSEVWSSFLCWKFGVKSVNILEMIIFQDAFLHWIVLLSSFSIFLLLLLVSLTFNPFTAKYYKEVMVRILRNKFLTPPSLILS